MFNKWSKEKSDIYKERLLKLQKDLKQSDAKRTEPEKVAILIAKELLKKSPKVRYRIGYIRLG